jgi:acetamidase/formamidase
LFVYTIPILELDKIKNNDSADDIRDVDLSIVHVLSGPIWVNGAEPGDILVVDIVDIGALQGDEWGFTGIFDKKNGGGFLTDHYPTASKAIWDLQGIYTSSRHIPGVKFAGITHPGLIGCAPSQSMSKAANSRWAICTSRKEMVKFRSAARSKLMRCGIALCDRSPSLRVSLANPIENMKHLPIGL